MKVRRSIIGVMCTFEKKWLLLSKVEKRKETRVVGRPQLGRKVFARREAKKASKQAREK